ncbi:MAG: class I SAM-dependent methyltransferase [Candidatus Thiodiazotropha sp. (ex Epidulcina cf. delphinae)]|nr:class I SAM-dependent methyltransferase [Candidatus Thiodiazotropha sp. (ex Epidulcina cf. delphinae)]
MDKITAGVRAFYEAYPYPPGSQADCDGYHARLLLSYLQHPQGESDTLRVLEAGCGRGVNLLSVASEQKDIEFTGIDINRVAIDEAAGAAAEKGLGNLRFALADLLNRQTLTMPGGGYHVILSYGVIHHLSDPLQGLRQLREILAPHGVIALMVDGCYGRQPLDRYLQALAIVESRHRSPETRLPLARALARVAEKALFKRTCWQGTADVEAVEFADRCLHVHERSYDINGLWQLLESAGLRFIRWLEPADWSLSGLTDDPELLRRLQALDETSRYRLLERLVYRPKLTLVAARQADMPRKPLQRHQMISSRFLLNPQLHMIEGEGSELCCRLRRRRLDLHRNGCAQRILLQAKALSAEFTGQTMIGLLGKPGFEPDQVVDGLHRMVEKELLYCPHS